MSQITIQCRLVASEPTRQFLWELMAERNTPLINELLAQMAQQPDLEQWRQKGAFPAGVVKKLCEPLRKDPRFIGQPGRFYSSAMPNGGLRLRACRIHLQILAQTPTTFETKARRANTLARDA